MFSEPQPCSFGSGIFVEKGSQTDADAPGLILIGPARLGARQMAIENLLT